jgi:hypothetical protein
MQTRKICNQLKEALGVGWTVQPHHVNECVYYFICSKNELNFLTHSYAVYPETNADLIIKKEKPLILSLYEKKVMVK